MSTPSDDAQRDMEQRALRNVRSLVDKLETTDKLEGKALRRLTMIVIGSVVAVCALGFVAWQLMAKRHAEQSTRPVVVAPPANAPK